MHRTTHARASRAADFVSQFGVDGGPRHSGSAVARGAGRVLASAVWQVLRNQKSTFGLRPRRAPRQRRMHKISANPQHASKAGLVRRASLLAARGLSHVTGDDCRSAASFGWKCSGAGLGQQSFRTGSHVAVRHVAGIARVAFRNPFGGHGAVDAWIKPRAYRELFARIGLEYQLRL